MCLHTFLGANCMEFKQCGHTYCKICFKEYIVSKIGEGSVKSIPCPNAKCKSEVTPDQVKELVAPELYEKYERLLLQVTLDSMSDVVYCPRKLCRYRVINDRDENLATCPRCLYNFCVYCHKVCHGVAPCAVNVHEHSKLIAEYQAVDRKKSRELVKKYGRKHFRMLVEKHLTNIYLKENTKQCPNCMASTTKTEGCNTMICGYCRARFCWLCGKHLTEADLYISAMRQTIRALADCSRAFGTTKASWIAMAKMRKTERKLP